MNRDAMAISGLHHVSIRVADLDRARAFYEGALGLRAEVSFTLGGRRFVLLEAGNGAYVELAEAGRGVSARRDASAIAHFALRTDDLERTLDSVRRAGQTILVPVKPLDLTNDTTGRPFPIRIAFVCGPDGEVVELFEDRNDPS